MPARSPAKLRGRRCARAGRTPTLREAAKRAPRRAVRAAYHLRFGVGLNRAPPCSVFCNDPELRRIVARVAPGARILRAEALGNDGTGSVPSTTAKATGYGIPIRIDIEAAGRVRRLVLHGTSCNAFGHDRRADRAAEVLLAADTFAAIPRHARVLDVGAFRSDRGSVSLANTGEFYLLTEYLDGTPYAEDLRRIAGARALIGRDLDRVDILADYLVALHVPVDGHPWAYRRSLRDLLGSGEGIFGIVDAYGTSTPGANPERLQRIEARCLEWRWRLKQEHERLARIHGDFHPFNVLFDTRSELGVLDASRGSLGDPADDVACMAVNFVFFAVGDDAAWRAGMAALWRRFWNRYLDQTNDERLLSVVAPFLAWRLLVLACPFWYPNQSPVSRERLLSLCEAALAQERFDPELAERVFR